MRLNSIFRRAVALIVSLCLVVVFSVASPVQGQEVVNGHPAIDCTSVVSATVRNVGKVSVNVFFNGEQKITNLLPGKSKTVTGLCKGMQYVQTIPAFGKFIPQTLPFNANRSGRYLAVLATVPAKSLK
jgi:hypothetical protein